MSKPFAAFALPPDERPGAALQNRPTEDLFIGRDVVAAESDTEILPGLALVTERIGETLDELHSALDDLKLGQAQGNWGTAETAAQRLVRLATHVDRTIRQARTRESSLQPKE